MRNLNRLEFKLGNGEISDGDLDALIGYHSEMTDRIWGEYIREEDLKKKIVIRERRDIWEREDTNFWKLVIEFLLFKCEK